MTDEAWTTRPSGTVSFLFTDIEGSTRLWDEHPDAMAEALALHDGLVRKAIDRHDGHVFATGGDGFAAVFSRASDAAAAAIELQVALGEALWPADAPLHVRAGLHSGEVHERDGDYFGPAVNQAARLMGAANGGQIIVSGVTASLIDGLDGVELLDLGPIHLSGMVEPVRAFGVSTPRLPWVDRPISTGRHETGNLTRPPTEFIGDLVSQRRAIAELRGARLVTLTGSGGVGKTRTAIETAWMLEDEFPDGCWIVELAPISDPEAVVPALLSALPAQAQPGMTLTESVVDWCGPRRLMLIIDNCEHVLDVVNELVRAIVGSCESVTVVATSREPLGVPGEQVIRIPSLDRHHSIELFRARAATADSSFETDSVDTETIGAICDRLDGIPLAIELAAARVRVLHPREILQRLDDRFRLLRGGGRGGLERHQTLRATVTWSYQLLSAAEQLLFDRLSVFAGTFELAEAEAICSDDQLDELDVVDLLGELVDKSMVIAERGDDRTLYRLLETLRQYGEERLDDRMETTLFRDRHLAHFARLSSTLSDAQWSGDEAAAIEAFGRSWGNFRAAHQWAIATGAMAAATDIVDATVSLAVTRLNFDHETWIERTVAMADGDPGRRARLLGSAAGWRFLRGDPRAAIAMATEALALTDEPESVVPARTFLAYGLLTAGRFGEVPAAAQQLEAALAGDIPIRAEIFARMALVDTAYGTPDLEPQLDAFAAVVDRARSRVMQSTVARYRSLVAALGEPPRNDEAIAYATSAVAIADETDNLEQGCWARLVQAFALRDEHDARSIDTLLDALRFAERARHRLALSSILETAPLVLLLHDDAEGAATLSGFLSLAPPLFQPSVETRAETARLLSDLATISESDHERWNAIGSELDLFGAVAYALSRLEAARGALPVEPG